MTDVSRTEQKSASLRRSDGGIGRSQRTSRMSGWMPMERSSFTECCVGLVFNSPGRRDEGHQGEVDVEARPARQLGAELTDRLEERQALDVADRAADLHQDEVVVLVAVEHELP